MTPPSHSSIELASGAFLDLLHPRPVMTLTDVAHGLSNTCRFAGQVHSFYSVAEHAVLVAQYLHDRGESPLVVLCGLHHDDAEAFLGDVTRPLKALLPDYPDLEGKMTRAIQVALGLPGAGGIAHAAVKAADDWALYAEAYALLPSRGSWLDAGGVQPPPEGVGPSWQPRLLPPRVAEREFLAFHEAAYAALPRAVRRVVGRRVVETPRPADGRRRAPAGNVIPINYKGASF